MDKYVVLDLIGEGSFGKVYKGRQKWTKQIVALKFIPKLGKSHADLSALQREIGIMQRLHHSNVVALYDWLETDTEVCVVTEFAEGDLYQILEDDKRLSVGVVKGVACQLVSALFYLHTHQILHRDMKPQNILVGKFGQIKLCDFGFARIVNAGPATSIKGTPLYMSPELVQENAYDHKADLWALGCILFELHTGLPPFYSHSIIKLVKMIIRDPIQWPTDMEPVFKDFLEGLLQKNPDQRLTWPHLLYHPFVHDSINVAHEMELARTSCATLGTTHSLSKTTSNDRIDSNNRTGSNDADSDNRTDSNDRADSKGRTDSDNRTDSNNRADSDDRNETNNDGVTLIVRNRTVNSSDSTSLLLPLSSSLRSLTSASPQAVRDMTQVLENIITQIEEISTEEDQSDSVGRVLKTARTVVDSQVMEWLCKALKSGADREQACKESEEETGLDDNCNSGDTEVMNLALDVLNKITGILLVALCADESCWSYTDCVKLAHTICLHFSHFSHQQAPHVAVKLLNPVAAMLVSAASVWSVDDHYLLLSCVRDSLSLSHLALLLDHLQTPQLGGPVALLAHLVSLDSIFSEKWTKVLQEEGLGVRGIGAGLQATEYPQLCKECVILCRHLPKLQTLQDLLIQLNLN